MNQTSPHIVLTIASAGTGKTYSLVENYLKALLGLDGYQKRRPKEILALTFTEKAALEMRQRIASRIATLIDEPEHDPLFSQFGQVNQEELKRLESAMQEANIATFHSFAMNVLREFAVDLNIFSQFEIMTGVDERRYAESVMRGIILSEVKQDNQTLKSLIARFRLVNQGGGGLINHLIFLAESIKEKGLSALDLSCSFNESSLSAKLSAFEHEINMFKTAPLTATAVQRIEAIERRYHEFCHVLNDGLNETKIALYLERLLITLKGNFGPPSFRKNLVDAAHELCAHLVDYFVQGDEQEIIRLLQLFSADYEQKKKEHGFLTYGDLLLFTKEALVHHPHIRQKLKMRFSHILVDEYQDTSPLQEDILALLIETTGDAQTFLNPRSLIEQVHLDGSSSLFVVGDKKQSIYSFRGAMDGIFERIEAMSARHHHDLIRHELNINRRSTQKILTVANLIAREALVHQGYKKSDELVPFHANDNQSDVSLWTFDEENLTAPTACALGIKNLLAQNSLKPSDMAILTRKRSSIKSIKDALLKLGIPARIMHGEGFYQQQEVVDLIAALKLCVVRHHEVAFCIVARSPLLLLRDDDLVKLKLRYGLHIEGLCRYVNEQEVPLTIRARALALSQVFQKISDELLQKDVAWALRHIIDATDFMYTLGLCKAHAQKLANIEKLLAIGLKDENPQLLINRLFGYITTNFDEPTEEASHEENAVTIMTVHQSKGLEFPLVVLADCESGGQRFEGDVIFDGDLGLCISPKGRPIKAVVPSNDRIKTRFQRLQEKKRQEKTEEEARLLYVAFTRAKSHFYALLKERSLKERKSDGLIGILLKALHRNEDAFFELASIKNIENDAYDEIETPNGVLKPLSEHSSDVFLPEYSPRIFASTLSLAQNHSSLKSFTYLATHSTINGDLAHTLLNKTVESINSLSSDQIVRLIDASFRQKGEQSSPKNLRTKEAVFNTLVLLKSLFIDAQSVLSELPLEGRYEQKIVLEGFADLVFFKRGEIFLIDYKSSSFLANHPNTYAQLLAYSYSLQQKYFCPINFCSLVIGSLEAPLWQQFDDRAEGILKDAVLNHLSKTLPG